MKKTIRRKDETYEEWTERMHDLLRGLLFLSEWSSSLLYSEKSEGCKHDGFLLGECKTDIKYLGYTITLYPECKKKFEEGRYKPVFHTMVHEMCHVYTEPLYERAIHYCPVGENDAIETLREQTTQRMTNALFNLIDKKRIIPKKKDVKLRKTGRR